MTEKAVKKVNYSILSNKICPDCGRRLKQNSAIKNHKYCYVCFKIRQGKTIQSIYKIEKGSIVFPKEIVRRIDRFALQKENRQRYNWAKNAN